MECIWIQDFLDGGELHNDVFDIIYLRALTVLRSRPEMCVPEMWYSE